MNISAQQQDQAARWQALDPDHSLIVQAPAGSGKTELLMQRFLKILATRVKQPEEILAITFTRKAAAEMRQRIIAALQEAATNANPPTSPHLALRRQLAQAVLQQDATNDWRLLQNPNRLNIQTIDAFAAKLTASLPLQAGYGAALQISDYPAPYYHRAIRQCLLDWAAATPPPAALVQLLQHLDNQIPLLDALLHDLLARREQWLPHIMPFYRQSTRLRQQLEQSFGVLITEKIHAINQQFTSIEQQSLLTLAQFAGRYLQTTDNEHPLTAWANLSSWPKADLDHLPLWLGLAQLLLTVEGHWRRQIDKRLGFPSDKSKGSIARQHKEHLLALLSTFNQRPDLERALAELLKLPPPIYHDSQWALINALLELLPLLASQLQVTFQAAGCVDFIELNLAALRALQQHDQPSELALSLDYQIQHLLVDEFQDTSLLQYELLQQLTQEWQNGDGRSLFLVGDPMQSIYRFRNAEVGLFLRTQQQGLGHLTLTPLTLQLNFRSQPSLIDWFNQVYPSILGGTADITTGRVSYTPVSSPQTTTDANAVQCHLLLDTSLETEAQRIGQLIRHYQTQDPASSIAILVRSRSHLRLITPYLHQQGIALQAVDIEPLTDYSEIIDLYNLTNALCQLADQTAWLALLRAPFSGLTLADLFALTQAAAGQPLLQTLLQWENIPQLSEDGRQRLERLAPALHALLKEQGRQSLSAWLRSAWLALGVPATYTHPQQLIHAQAYFDLVSQLEQSPSPFSLALLKERLNRLFANTPTLNEQTVQIMTVHRAKGLEFDHVILPGLNRKLAADPNRLLLWLERPNLTGGSDLLLAPLKKASTASKDPHYQYLAGVERQKAQHETARLLYVATTRAKQSLHLITTLSRHAQRPAELVNAESHSFCALLRPHYPKTAIQALLEQPSHSSPQDLNNPGSAISPSWQRLTSGWALPALTNGQAPYWTSTPMAMSDRSPPQLAQDRLAIHLGNAIHQALAMIAQDSRPWLEQPGRVDTERPRWRQLLRQAGLLPRELNSGEALLRQALRNTLNDPHGRWILDPNHGATHNEWALSGIHQGQLTHVVIDRSFVTADNKRWIIDYKTATPAIGQSMTEFFDKQQAEHQTQLLTYATIVQAYTQDTAINLGLYFPLAPLWYNL